MRPSWRTPYKKRPPTCRHPRPAALGILYRQDEDSFDNQTLGPLFHLIDHWSDPDDSDTVEMINGPDAGTRGRLIPSS